MQRLSMVQRSKGRVKLGGAGAGLCGAALSTAKAKFSQAERWFCTAQFRRAKAECYKARLWRCSVSQSWGKAWQSTVWALPRWAGYGSVMYRKGNVEFGAARQRLSEMVPSKAKAKYRKLNKF